MNRDFLKEAIADAKAVKESAIANAKVALEEAFTPQLKSMLAAKLDEMDSADEDDVKEMRGMSYEEDDDSMREEMRGKSMEDDTMEEMTDPDMRHGEDEDGKPETGALEDAERDREINEDEEVNLDEILAFNMFPDGVGNISILPITLSPSHHISFMLCETFFKFTT